MYRILVVTRYYLPAYQAGGTPRSLANLVESLGDEFEFRVVTLDRGLHDQEPYPNIRVDQWQRVGKADVMYLSPRHLSVSHLRSMLRVTDYDVLYLNSCFATTTPLTLLLRRLGLIPDKPLILAPRGEFSRGALQIRSYKKAPYLWLSRQAGLYKSITWQATSEHELNDILAVIGSGSPPRISIAPNFVVDLSGQIGLSQKSAKIPSRARVVFLSRISRKKNLDYALNLLGSARGEIKFDIFGPVEDLAYWRGCQDIISRLPANIQVSYRGVLEPDQVIRSLAQYDLFLMPTRGENYGHAIIESLLAGCPVLISDQTPWQDLEERKAGWHIPLTQPERYASVLRSVVQMTEAELLEWKQGALEYARQVVSDPSVAQANRMLFRNAIEGVRTSAVRRS